MNSERLNYTIGLIKESVPFLEDSIRESRRCFGEKFEQIGEDLCSVLLSLFDNDERRYIQAVKGYVKFCAEHLLLQRRLERSGHYIHDDFEKVNSEVYNNSAAMDGYYLSGLFFSTIFWPNHLRMFLFFLEVFVKGVKKYGQCCELGVGHGWLVSSLLKERDDLKAWGVDINTPALVFTEKLLSARKINKDNYSLRQYDIRSGVSCEDSAFDAVIFAEVLEHLDNPLFALREILRILKPGGLAYITTAIFAASIDHIYLFESLDEAKKIILDSGLIIKEELVLPVYGNSRAGDRKIPVNFACVTEKPF